METTERALQQLERRVERLEHLVVQLVCWAASLTLVVGAFLRFMPVTEGSDEDDVFPRIFTAGFHAVGYRTSDGEGDGISIAFGIGFLGLVLVAAMAIWLMGVIGSQSATERTATWLKAVLVTLVIGTCIAALFTLFGLGSDEVEVGPGILVFGAGVGLCLLVNTSALREWWDPSRRVVRR